MHRSSAPARAAHPMGVPGFSRAGLAEPAGAEPQGACSESGGGPRVEAADTEPAGSEYAVRERSPGMRVLLFVFRVTCAYNESLHAGPQLRTMFGLH